MLLSNPWRHKCDPLEDEIRWAPQDAVRVVCALQHAFDGMNMIFDRFGFPEDELEKMSDGLVEVMQQAGMM